MPQEMKKRLVNTPAGAGGEDGEGRGTHREKKERVCSATCMVRGGGEGGGKRKERMRRAGGKKGADAACASKREHGGAVTTFEWRCERPDGRARWRDDGRERRRSADTADLFWAVASNTVRAPRRHLSTLLEGFVIACMCNPSGPERS